MTDLLDILGRGPAVHYPSAYREFGGIMMLTCRGSASARAGGSLVLDRVSVAIGFTEVVFA